jgi:hypothetical protein
MARCSPPVAVATEQPHHIAEDRQRCEVDMRSAAYIGALENIGKVYQMRGIFP